MKGHFIQKIIFLFALIYLFPASIFSQEHHVPKKDMMNYNGRKLSKKNNNFIVTGIKVDKEETEEVITFTVYFNDVIDTASLGGENILINNQAIKDDVSFLFNKNRNVMQFSVHCQEYQIDKNFSLEIKGSLENKPVFKFNMYSKNFIKSSVVTQISNTLTVLSLE